jgi:hypothetical protein
MNLKMQSNKVNLDMEDAEDGEVKVYDEQAYIVSNGELFKYQTHPNVEVNWRAIRSLDDDVAE